MPFVVQLDATVLQRCGYWCI